MHPMMDYAFSLLNRVIDFLLRKRSIAGAFLKVGSVITVPTLGSGWALGVIYHDPSRALDFNIQTTDGVPGWAVLIALFLGLSLILIGFIIGVWDWWRARRAEIRRKAIIVEIRGLHSSPDTPASTADLSLPSGARDLQIIDFRPAREGMLVDPDLALEKLVAMKRSVESASGGRAKEDITVALGGLAAVPILFLAGMLFDDESNVVVFDWDRNRKIWRLTDGVDDGKRLLPMTPLAVTAGAMEVVLAVSASYPVDEQAISRVFTERLPVLHLRAEEMLADRLWSVTKQQAFVVAFRDAIQNLMARGVQRIHLILAAPASLCIRMGMAYDRRLMPDLIVHQYERSALTPYPWGLRMPTHGRLAATVEWCDAKSDKIFMSDKKL